MRRVGKAREATSGSCVARSVGAGRGPPPCCPVPWRRRSRTLTVFRPPPVSCGRREWTAGVWITSPVGRQGQGPPAYRAMRRMPGAPAPSRPRCRSAWAGRSGQRRGRRGKAPQPREGHGDSGVLGASRWDGQQGSERRNQVCMASLGALHFG